MLHGTSWQRKSWLTFKSICPSLGTTVGVSGSEIGESPGALVGKVLPGSTFHQHVLLPGLVSVVPICLSFYQLPWVDLSFLLVVCCPGLCPGGCLLMCWLCWPQSLSLRLMSSGEVFGLEILKYSGKTLNPVRREEECPNGTHCSRGSLTYTGSLFFFMETCLPSNSDLSSRRTYLWCWAIGKTSKG